MKSHQNLQCCICISRGSLLQSPHLNPEPAAWENLRVIQIPLSAFLTKNGVTGDLIAKTTAMKEHAQVRKYFKV